MPKPLLANTFNMPFRRPKAQIVRSHIMTIAYKGEDDTMSSISLSLISMDFDEAKDLAKVNEKYTIFSPFDVTNKILGPGQQDGTILP
ncbi:hypothetical protein K503DRAFT_804614 [Rhizopogon vinicolor AM-OR11-026]|uniref:Uncharacterized protein n=1 Tax=Rhizopogon vinicolor AM-OR11-026 TaxID=1314800 RepID=A0A1B7MKN4_9AGAM|nr:hypothetical protein K503DRAFT_804614 [Rhizopogon vinicolor AM-OR11-026]